MKKILLIILMFTQYKNLFAAQAVVISFRAPMQSEAKNDASTYQVLKKGEVIFVADKDLKTPSFPGFYETIDRSGRTAYVKAEYLKIIYKDEREYNEPISYINPKTKHDSTDYRIEEPIPHTYPFESREFTRMNISFALGSNPKSPYQYEGNINSQNFSYDIGLKLNYQKKLDFDQVDRLYFGVFSSVSSVTNKITFTNGDQARENRAVIRLGPILSFDFYKTNSHLLNLGTGFTWNLHRSSLLVDAENVGEEDRLFTGFSISPFVQSMFAFRDVYPNLDFTLGSELSFYLPHKQSASGLPEFSQYWNSENPSEFKQNLTMQAQFFMGLNFKY